MTERDTRPIKNSWANKKVAVFVYSPDRARRSARQVRRRLFGWEERRVNRSYLYEGALSGVPHLVPRPNVLVVALKDAPRVEKLFRELRVPVLLHVGGGKVITFTPATSAPPTAEA